MSHFYWPSKDIALKWIFLLFNGLEWLPLLLVPLFQPYSAELSALFLSVAKFSTTLVISIAEHSSE